MAEIGIASGVIGIVGFTIQSIQQLVSTIDAVRNVPEKLIVVRRDLQALASSMTTLSTMIVEGSSDDRNQPLEQALAYCSADCDEFGRNLNKWTNGSQGDDVRWRDKLQIGWLKDGAVRAFNERILQSKGTLAVALGVINT